MSLLYKTQPERFPDPEGIPECLMALGYHIAQQGFGYYIGPIYLLLLVFAGCTGCGGKEIPSSSKEEFSLPPQKTAPPQKNAQQAQQAQKNAPLSNVAPASGKSTIGATAPAPATPVQTAPSPPYSGLRPWPPKLLPPDVKKRADERVEASYQRYKAGKVTLDEHLERALQMAVEESGGLIPYMRDRFGRGAGVTAAISKLIDKAYAENPHDFDLMLAWVHGGGLDFSVADAEEQKRPVLYQLYEMNPNQPYVNHHLALSIYGMRPQEALGYAQKAQQLEPRYIPYALDGHCYYQMGDYEKALAAYQRAEAVVPAHLTRTARNRVEKAKRGLAGDFNEPLLERLRARGVRLMGTMMLSNNPL